MHGINNTLVIKLAMNDRNRGVKGIIGVAIILGSLFFILAFIGLLYYSINFRVRSLVEEALAREEAKLHIVEVTEAYYKPEGPSTINITVKSPMRLHIVLVFLCCGSDCDLRFRNYVVEEGSIWFLEPYTVCPELSVKLVTAEGAVIPVPRWVVK